MTGGSEKQAPDPDRLIKFDIRVDPQRPIWKMNPAGTRGKLCGKASSPVSISAAGVAEILAASRVWVNIGSSSRADGMSSHLIRPAIDPMQRIWAGTHPSAGVTVGMGGRATSGIVMDFRVRSFMVDEEACLSAFRAGKSWRMI